MLFFHRHVNAPTARPSVIQHPRPQPARQFGADRIALVGFHDRAFIVAKPADSFAPWLQERIQGMPGRVAGNSTNLAAGLEQAIQLLDHVPHGQRKRIWLLSDGLPNAGNERIAPLLRQARDRWININTVAFGDFGHANPQILRDIAKATHNGQFFEVRNLRELRDALGVNGLAGRTHRNHRTETTVYAIDCSGSMVGPMERRRKIDVVVEALTALLAYKQAMWS